MNVFVLCAGRTASTAFSAACLHIENFTSAHESRVNILGKEKLIYPENHIEVDNRLSWFIPQLEEKYGDDAFYVYLKRDSHKIAKSYLERWGLTESIVKAYGHGILMMPTITKEQRYDVCLDYVHHVEQSIAHFLKNKSHTLEMNTDSLKEDFGHFWEGIGAQGNFESALAEFDVQHNLNNTSVLTRLKRLVKG